MITELHLTSLRASYLSLAPCLFLLSGGIWSYMLLLPLLGIWQLTQMDAGTFGTITIFGLETPTSG